MRFHTLGGTAPGHAEVVVQRVAMEVLHPLGQVAQGEAHVQHLVVEGEVAHGDQVQALLAGPVACAQFGAQLFQCIAGGFAFPVGLQRELEFTLGADARKAEVVDGGHGMLLLSSSVVRSSNGGEC